MANTGAGNNGPTPTPGPLPDPNTGDILDALQNEQATMATIADWGKKCSTTLATMQRDQRLILTEIKKQTALLTDIRDVLKNLNTSQTQFRTQQIRQQQTQNQQSLLQQMRVNGLLGDLLGMIDKQHRQETKILHVVEDRAKDLNRSAIQNLIITEASRFESDLRANIDEFKFGNSDFQDIIDHATDENKQKLADLQDAFENELKNVGLADQSLQNLLESLSHDQLAQLAKQDKNQLATNSILSQFTNVDDADFAALQQQLKDIEQTFADGVNQIYESQQIEDMGSDADIISRFNQLVTGADILEKIDSILNSSGMGQGNDLGNFFKSGAGPAGEAFEDWFKDATGEAFGSIGATVGTFLGGPVGGEIGKVIGEVVGERVAANLGEAIERTGKALGELMETYAYHNRKTRDELIKLSFEKIRQDAKTMATYQIDVIEAATQKIYDAWDTNLTKVNATMNYTKAQLNTLQDSVAQKLIDEGYGNVIDASNYLDELAKTLDANLNSRLAAEFAAQALILEKAIPEFDATSMAKEFGAIYTRANQQGEDGTQAMKRAMEQIAGATKAIEETTDGNNQFITKIDEYLQKSTEIVSMTGGSVDQIADLTTQMMAAEGPIGSLTPQLTGFAGELVDILTDSNNSTATALRAIMHDINSDIGISYTDFMNSFITDTQGTLETAFKALEQFINNNSSDGARFEFLDAMSDIFGVSTEKLAQIDFGYVAEQLSKTNETLNKTALTAAEQLLKDGETTTLEEQLVANTANQLLATNQVRDTLDNKVMRELEKHELELERQVLALTATQSVDLAESTMGFFYKLKDIVVDLLDPLGVFKGVSSLVAGVDSWTDNQANYKDFQSLNSITSALEDTQAANERTARLTVEGAHAIYDITNSETWKANKTNMFQDIVEKHGITNQNLIDEYKEYQSSVQSSSEQSSKSIITSYTGLSETLDKAVAAQQSSTQAAMNSMTDATYDISQDLMEMQDAEARREEEYRQARLRAQEEALAREEENYSMNVDNHANLEEMSGNTGVNVENVSAISNELVQLQEIVTERSVLIETKQDTTVDSIVQLQSELVEESTLIQGKQDNAVVAITQLQSAMTEESTLIQGKQGVISELLSQFHTTYSDSIHNLETNIKDKSDEHVTTLVSAIKDSKPDVSSLHDIKEGVERVITLFSTYLEILDNAMVQSTGQGLQMASSDRDQILGRGLLR